MVSKLKSALGLGLVKLKATQIFICVKLPLKINQLSMIRLILEPS